MDTVECTMYLLDANIIASVLLGGRAPRKCLKACTTQYLVPKCVVDELVELVRDSKKLRKMVARIERKLSTGGLSVEKILAEEVEFIAILEEFSWQT